MRNRRRRQRPQHRPDPDRGPARLEYRGYDSCGVAVHQDGELRRARSTARVAELDAPTSRPSGIAGGTGIAHTRWATHGAPAVHNAHPHFSHGPDGRSRASASRAGDRAGPQRHHREPRRAARRAAGRGYAFASQTDTEVIAHLVDHLYDGDLFEAVQRAAAAAARRLRDRRVLPRRAAPRGRRAPGLAAGARRRQPRRDENFLASDAMALAGVTDQIVYLEEGDVVDLQLGKHWISARDADGRLPRASQRAVRTVRGAHRRRRARARTATTCRRRSSSSRKAIADTLDARARRLARAVRRRRATASSRRSTRC